MGNTGASSCCVFNVFSSKQAFGQCGIFGVRGWGASHILILFTRFNKNKCIIFWWWWESNLKNAGLISRRRFMSKEGKNVGFTEYVYEQSFVKTKSKCESAEPQSAYSWTWFPATQYLFQLVAAVEEKTWAPEIPEANSRSRLFRNHKSISPSTQESGEYLRLSLNSLLFVLLPLFLAWNILPTAHVINLQDEIGRSVFLGLFSLHPCGGLIHSLVWYWCPSK